MYMVKYIIQKLFSSQIHLSYHDFSVLFEGVLETVINCIKSKLWKKNLFFKEILIYTTFTEFHEVLQDGIYNKELIYKY